MKERIAIIDGIRSPQSKAGMSLKNVSADDLGAHVVRELMNRSSLKYEDIDEVIIGNVAQPSTAANIARVVALKAGFPIQTPAFTVHRNCASGMEAVSSAATKILAGEAEIIVAGGTESMSNIPLLYNSAATDWFAALPKMKTLMQKLGHFLKLRPRFFNPRIGLIEGLTDPVCGLVMGLTAENLAREFHITRQEQDAFALASHQKAVKATQSGRFNDEITPVPYPSKDGVTFLTQDEGPRDNQTLEALAKLKPYFDRKNGTVTVGNACPITDGACAFILMSESKARKLKLTPLGFVTAFEYAGLEPERMGLGPVYATAKLLNKTRKTFADIDVMEINEAFAAQVLACLKAFESVEFAKTYLNQDHAVGKLNPDILNVNGGGVALGHPVGATGARIILTVLHELKRRNQSTGIASLCIGGGQGASFLLESK